MEEIKKVVSAVLAWVKGATVLVANQATSIVSTVGTTIQTHIANPKQAIAVIIVAAIALDLIFGKIGIVGSLVGILTSLLASVSNIRWEGLCALIVVYFIIDRLKK